MKIHCEISGLGLHGSRCRFPSFLNEESPHQSHAAKPHWSSGGCHVRTRGSKSPETETRPVCISVSDHVLHHNANHPGWLAHSDTLPDFMVPPIHMRNKHDMTYGTLMTNSWHCVAATLCDGFMRLFMSLNAI